MNFDQIIFQLNHSPSIKLLRSEHASLALGFFHFSFKSQGHLKLLYSQLEVLLEDYINDLAQEVRENYTSKPAHYLNLWCDDKHRFLRKYYELENDEPVMELTYDTERALEWMVNLEKQEFVGTQSRFYTIFENLKNIAENADDSPEARLKQLGNKKKHIEKEMKEIKLSGKIKRMDETQMKERFLNFFDDSRKLISDFQRVEDIFKEITRNIKEQKLKRSVTKGDILGNILDAYDYLEESDQGKSFEAFWNFLTSTKMQEELREVTDIVLNIPEIQSFIEKNSHKNYARTMKRLKGQLLQVGQKVLKSKFRLSEELRKLLHQKSLAENKKVSEEILEIKGLLIENLKHFFEKPNKEFISLNFLPNVNLPMERPLWIPRTDTCFTVQTLDENKGRLLGEAELEKLVGYFSVDMIEMENNIRILLESNSQMTLKNLIKHYPISKGITEIVAYISLAHKKDEHLIDSDLMELIDFKTLDGEGEASVPQIIFGK